MSTPLRPTTVGFNAVTITLASLATSAGLTAGRGSLAIDMSAQMCRDVQVYGTIKTGAAITAGVIQVWVYSSIDGASTYPDTISGADANITLTDANTRNSGLKMLTQITATLSNQAYSFGPISLSEAYSVATGKSRVVPVKWGIWVTHNTVSALNASGSSVNWNGQYDLIG